MGFCSKLIKKIPELEENNNYIPLFIYRRAHCQNKSKKYIEKNTYRKTLLFCAQKHRKAHR